MGKVVELRYTVLNERLEEVTHHLETNSGIVKVLNQSKDELGTLSDFMFSGKVVENGSFKDLKVSGIYRVRGLKDLPSDVRADKTCILSINAVGDIGNPTMVKYTLTTFDGTVKSCVLADGVYSKWSDGGLAVERSLGSLRGEIGNRGELQTNSKGSIVAALNELDKNIKLNQRNNESVSKEVQDLKGHNHDTRYLKLSGGQLSGDITLNRGVKLKYANAYGRELNAISTSGSQLTIGNKLDETHIESSSSKLLFNGRNIVTEENIGSVIERDPNINLSQELFVKRSGGIMTGDLKMTGESDLILYEDNNSKYGAIRWRGSDGAARGVLYVDDSGRLRYDSKGESVFMFDSYGDQHSMGKINFNSFNRESGFNIKLDSTDKGMGMYRNKSSKYLGFYNWDKQKRLGFFSDTDNALHLDEAIFIQDRRLWLQNSQPSGNHRVGDIWIG